MWKETDLVQNNNFLLSIPSAQPQELVTCKFTLVSMEFVFVISSPEFVTFITYAGQPENAFMQMGNPWKTVMKLV